MSNGRMPDSSARGIQDCHRSLAGRQVDYGVRRPDAGLDCGLRQPDAALGLSPASDASRTMTLTDPPRWRQSKEMCDSPDPPRSRSLSCELLRSLLFSPCWAF